MLLAGDLGGTKTLLGLYEGGTHRPRPLVTRSYSTQDFNNFIAILDAFVHETDPSFVVDAAVVGVAGAVLNQKARLTNIAWDVTAIEIGERLATHRVKLVNDVEAMALGVSVLSGEELVVLQRGVPVADGNIVVIAAGTGLGEAYLYSVNGGYRPMASEGGHADFAPRTDAEIELLRTLRARYGRGEVEQVLSGPGLMNIYRFTHDDSECESIRGVDERDAPAAVSEAGLAGTCSRCAKAIGMFVETYGAEAGNLALRAVATGGVYIGGGIAPKILPALQDGRFMAEFLAKAPMAELLATVPVQVITNTDAGLIGAAVAAQELANDPN